MSTPKTKPQLELHGGDLFVVVDGQRVAKRGRPGTQASRAWIPLMPGWSVFDGTDGAVQVEHRPEDDDGGE